MANSYFQCIQEVNWKINRAIERTVRARHEEEIAQETSFTDQMLAAIRGAIDGFESEGIRWRSRVLPSGGPGSAEKQFGADFMVVLDVRLPEIEFTKGFLAQAKVAVNGARVDLRRLRHQCENMLGQSASSYVFFYMDNDVRVAPAISIAKAKRPMRVAHRSSERFFQDYLECFVGDRRLSGPRVLELESLPRVDRAGSVLLLQAGEAADGEVAP